CKDKTSLFITILKALNIDAYPALVDTENTKLLAEFPPGINLFDHVLVWLEFNGQQYWLDPTLSNQNGTLDNLYQPDYGYALVLKQGVDQLTPMSRDEYKSHTLLVEKYTIPDKTDSPVMFTVSTRYKGYEAIRQLWNVEQDGKNSIAESYEVFYQDSYPGLKTFEEMTIKEDQVAGEVIFNESYQIDDFWKRGDEHWEADFYPYEVRNSLFKPKQTQRDGPLAFSFPDNITQITELHFETDGWSFDSQEFTEDNPFFTYTSEVDFENDVLTIKYTYKAKADHIPEDKIDQYLEARDRVRGDAYYGIIKYIKDETANQVDSSSQSAATIEDQEEIDWWLVVVSVYCLGFLYIVAEWQIESRKRPSFPDSQYYPIATWKFVYLSIISFGIYNAYWMYRNWQAIKIKTGANMMPFWRGLFINFWVYALFLNLRQDSQEQFSKNKVLPAWLAFIIALAFFVTSIASNAVDELPWSMLYVLTPLLLIPFVRYINFRNTNNSDAIKFNTKWRIRHLAASIMIVPTLAIGIASETHFFPSEKVVTESQIWDRDLKFFYRQQLIPANESIRYFYSDALWDARDDGNGFTDKRVFSYWLDDEAGLQRESAVYEEIKNIETEFSKTELSNTIVTITRYDDSTFLLFVSNTDEGDKTFVEELTKAWKAGQK
ncbi:DUF4234 domain-containing protein, partial [Aliiglaciecola sp.]|nr:DUF4234 domain-containing protein [Aliiglaciecola sp.]